MLYKEWDSRVLGVPVYELEGASEATLVKGYGYAKFKYDIEAINNLEKHGFKLCDISVEYFLDLSRSPAYEIYGIRSLDVMDIDRVLEITRNSFYLDRFHKDPNLTSKQADNMYQEWVINACNGSYGDAVFVAEGGRDIVGFSSCRIIDNYGEIDLTAIDISNKDRNVSTNLIAADINFFMNNNLDFVKTSTQIENIPSRNSLLRFGFQELGFVATMSKGNYGK